MVSPPPIQRRHDRNSAGARGVEGFRFDLVPTWATVATWLTIACVLPSVAWRFVYSIQALIDGDPCFNTQITSWGEILYVVAILPAAQLGTACLTLGLIRPWGEIFPSWVPLVRGRQVPISLGVGSSLAACGFITLMIVFNVFVSDNQPTRDIPAGCNLPGIEVAILYSPLVAWPGLLLAVTWHYWRRRTS